MKSQVLRKFESKLEDMNDQLCYFLFSDIEVNNIFSELEHDISDSYTTEVYPENKFSDRLHIKIEALPAFRTKAFHSLVSMSVIASVEYLLSYIEEVEGIRANIMPSVHDEITDKKPEEQLNLKLRHWLGKDPESAIIKTIAYLRLRRNHIAHVREEMSDGYRSLIKNDSNHLNTYWAKQSTKLNGFDFSKKTYDEFEVNDVFALINLSRVCMREIDSLVLSTISEESIASYELPRFLANKKLNGLTVEVKSRKFAAFLQHQYGKKMSCADALLRDHMENA
ncbi:hypothetical protein [Alteromonas naphthalenivorans]|uniref:Uncharacterized protein n=1 Tax=Alteromonas naphthalenivorans TaxID=715451 RepID=F5ZES6_ALTNA|nr:hypothetical protein [Alteromonas naphthalenivorans]AEF04626.1 hypothetical protein ambt_15580 [Alteromonas naphthalenivorans]